MRRTDALCYLVTDGPLDNGKAQSRDTVRGSKHTTTTNQDEKKIGA